jgi:hypothetical protein
VFGPADSGISNQKISINKWFDKLATTLGHIEGQIIMTNLPAAD